MRIVQNSPDVLHIDHNPWILRWVIWAASGAALVSSLAGPFDSLTITDRIVGLSAGTSGIVFGWYFLPHSAAILDRVLQTVTLTEKRFTGGSSVTHPLSEIDDVVATEGAGDAASLQSLLLVIGGVRTPLEKGYVAADRKAVRDETLRWLRQARA